MMMTNKVGHNKGSGSQTWSTPDDFYSAVYHEFHPTIDVCADEDNTKCLTFWSEESDGLEQGWFLGHHKVAWCNPGFSNMKPWVRKAIDEVHENPGCTALVLAPLSNAFWSINAEVTACEIRKCYPRIQFDAPLGIVNQKRNMYDNVLMVFRYTPVDWPGASIWSWNWKAAYERRKSDPYSESS